MRTPEVERVLSLQSRVQLLFDGLQGRAVEFGEIEPDLECDVGNQFAQTTIRFGSESFLEDLTYLLTT